MRFSDLEGRRITVWGAGVEIKSFIDQASARLDLKIERAIVDEPSPEEEGWLESRNIPVARGLGDEYSIDVLVRSPGVSIHRPELRALRTRTIPVVTPTGLLLSERGGANIIGITGTKGKSTTAALAAHICAAQGVPVSLAGNIGVPALELLDQPLSELAVIELSSYQIADLEIGTEVAVLVNLFSEHTDWHGSVDTYQEEKLRLLQLPGVEAYVLDATDPRSGTWSSKSRGETHYFSTPEGWTARAEGIYFRGELAARAASLPLSGPHNLLNLCAALTALEVKDISAPRDLAEALRGFEPLPHRLQVVADENGVVWVDDSISTTPESAIAAIDSYPDREIILIAGGQDRGQDHRELAQALLRRRAAVIGVPDTGDALLAAARSAGLPAERICAAEDLTQAVDAAKRLARDGSAVILSPAAPSYNAFRNFKERGDRFADLARS